MAPQALWSGSLRLSLVLIPVKLYPAVSTEDAVSFRMIHKPSGKPIRYLKGIEIDQGFKEVPEDEIIKGYEHTKGHYVLLKPEELDALKLEAKHTINLERFGDRTSLDSRYFEKPYYLLTDGDEADEGLRHHAGRSCQDRQNGDWPAHHAGARASGRHRCSR
jgi:DNA end-binding protein Ku